MPSFEQVGCQRARSRFNADTLFPLAPGAFPWAVLLEGFQENSLRPRNRSRIRVGRSRARRQIARSLECPPVARRV